MNLPERTDLPFFSYGLFKPGQLGFFRLGEFVQRTEPNCILSHGTLRERDGLPIIDEAGNGEVRGILIFFSPQSACQAYLRIIEIEPDKHYKWGVKNVVDGQKRNYDANVLLGRSPRKGSVPFEEPEWDGRKDPLFTSALEVVQETLQQNQSFEWNLKPLFRLQMAYLLLWSAIERYVSFRYHLGNKVTEKVEELAKECAFATSLQRLVSEKDKREVYRADRPSEKVRLDPSNPKESLQYYYQIRSNITHRGKSVMRDFELLNKSLRELYEIFRNVLKEAFETSEGAAPFLLIPPPLLPKERGI